MSSTISGSLNDYELPGVETPTRQSRRIGVENDDITQLPPLPQATTNNLPTITNTTETDDTSDDDDLSIPSPDEYLKAQPVIPNTPSSPRIIGNNNNLTIRPTSAASPLSPSKLTPHPTKDDLATEAEDQFIDNLEDPTINDDTTTTDSDVQYELYQRHQHRLSFSSTRSGQSAVKTNTYKVLCLGNSGKTTLIQRFKYEHQHNALLQQQKQSQALNFPELSPFQPEHSRALPNSIMDITNLQVDNTFNKCDPVELTAVKDTQSIHNGSNGQSQQQQQQQPRNFQLVMNIWDYTTPLSMGGAGTPSSMMSPRAMESSLATVLRGSHVALLVYDFTTPNASLFDLQQQIRQLQRMLAKECYIIVVLTKADLHFERRNGATMILEDGCKPELNDNFKEIISAIETYLKGVNVIPVSAIQGYNIDLLYKQLITLLSTIQINDNAMLQQQQQLEINSNNTSRQNGNNNDSQNSSRNRSGSQSVSTTTNNSFAAYKNNQRTDMNDDVTKQTSNTEENPDGNAQDASCMDTLCNIM